MLDVWDGWMGGLAGWLAGVWCSNGYSSHGHESNAYNVPPILRPRRWSRTRSTSSFADKYSWRPFFFSDVASLQRIRGLGQSSSVGPVAEEPN
ncbi:hypothetical protein IWX49DRAFT_157386 [Phyllosticta citricarpa]